MDKYRILVKGIVKCNEKYLVVEKWYDDRIFEPYQWEFIDGVMSFSETPEKAVQRIVEEDGTFCSGRQTSLYVGIYGRRSVQRRHCV